jgi:hypothetical protein
MQRGASGSHRSDAPRCICSCPNRALVVLRINAKDLCYLVISHDLLLEAAIK